MRFYQMTKEEREKIAKKSEEILKKDPRVTIKDLAVRFGISYNHLYNIRKEFGIKITKKKRGNNVLREV